MKKAFLLSIVFLATVLVSFRPGVTGPWNTASKAELKTAYDKAIAWFSENQSCSVNISYASYMDYTTLKPYDHSEGFYKRNRDNFHVSSMGITTIQNEKMCVVADTLNQIIILRKKATLNQGPVDAKGLSELLDNAASLKKQTLNSETAYRVEFKPNAAYSAFEFRVNSKGLFTSIIYFYSKEMQEDEEEKGAPKSKPRMEIAFSGYESNAKFDHQKEFSGKQFIKESTGKITLNDLYKHYELKDYRNIN
jgi:hypothetical protein